MTLSRSTAFLGAAALLVNTACTQGGQVSYDTSHLQPYIIDPVSSCLAENRGTHFSIVHNRARISRLINNVPHYNPDGFTPAQISFACACDNNQAERNIEQRLKEITGTFVNVINVRSCRDDGDSEPADTSPNDAPGRDPSCGGCNGGSRGGDTPEGPGGGTSGPGGGNASPGGGPSGPGGGNASPGADANGPSGPSV